jgi:hypothetical protein
MTRHGPHRLHAQAYQLRLTILLALLIRNSTDPDEIRRDVNRSHPRFTQKKGAEASTVIPVATVSARRLPGKNQKSP